MKWKMLDFFAGSGLVSYGLKDSFQTVWANDISPTKAAIYKANMEGEHFHLGDIKEVKGENLPFAHFSWVSFPCQDLSLAGNQGGIHAKRSGLVWEWLRVIDEMPEKPQVLLLENVVGLLATNNGENYKVLHQALVKRGYKSGAIVLNASRFVPQSRPRVFVIAVPQGMDIPAHLRSNAPTWLHTAHARQLGSSLDNWVWWKCPEPARRLHDLKDIVDVQAPFDKDAVLELLSKTHREYLERCDSVVAAGYRRTRNGSQTLELRFDGIAGCLRTPGGGSSKQYLVVKNKEGVHARLISVRESARLMGAPDSFQLPGSANDGYMAMGDAVAMPVAKFLEANLITDLLEVAYNEKH